MVGRPTLPADADHRSDLKGMAAPTPGLTALDQEREASMADEGGRSGAAMEKQAVSSPVSSPRRPRTPLWIFAMIAGVGVITAVTAIVVRRLT